MSSNKNTTRNSILLYNAMIFLGGTFAAFASQQQSSSPVPSSTPLGQIVSELEQLVSCQAVMGTLQGPNWAESIASKVGPQGTALGDKVKTIEGAEEFAKIMNAIGNADSGGCTGEQTAPSARHMLTCFFAPEALKTLSQKITALDTEMHNNADQPLRDSKTREKNYFEMLSGSICNTCCGTSITLMRQSLATEQDNAKKTTIKEEMDKLYATCKFCKACWVPAADKQQLVNQLSDFLRSACAQCTPVPPATQCSGCEHIPSTTPTTP